MRRQPAVKASLSLLLVAYVLVEAKSVHAALQLRCHWNAPTVLPNSKQVGMTPIVLNFGGPPLGTAKVAFITFETASDALNDAGGVLRIIDQNCNLIASFPNFPSCPSFQLPSNCPSNLFTTKQVSPISGLAGGNLDGGSDVEIVGVLDGSTTPSFRQIIAFNLIAGGCLKPKWCSLPVPIPYGSTPAIAQLDLPPHPAAQQSEVIIHNKVFESNGVLRYDGITYNNNCGSGVIGGVPCPQSRVIAVANVLNATLPQLITGRGTYRSLPGLFWTGTLGWSAFTLNSFGNKILAVSKINNVFPAIAELDPNSAGPEIIVSDYGTSRLRVLSSSTGFQLSSASFPSHVPGTTCGGPPMIANVDGLPGQEIGVASCNRYTVFKYSPNTPTVLWSIPINDPSGATTSTLYNSPTGAKIVYFDESTLYVLDGATGNSLQTIANTSGTGTEGPIIASFDTGQPNQKTCKLGLGRVIVPANNYHLTGGIWGIRIFQDNADIGKVGSCWNQHTFHVTNVANSDGAIPTVEQPSWLATSPARNTYRVQRW